MCFSRYKRVFGEALEMNIKKQKKKYRKLNSVEQIATTLGMHPTNIDKTYFNEKNPKKLKSGKALDIGVFVMRNGVTIEELVFMIDFIQKHKEFIRSKI